jgi:hypothetical protein
MKNKVLLADLTSDFKLRPEAFSGPVGEKAIYCFLFIFILFFGWNA